jgi:hypothetical protein
MRATSSTAPALPATLALRCRAVTAAEWVERQIAIIVVVAVVEATFLHAVERDVGIVEIDHDLARRAPGLSLLGLEEQIDQQRIDLGAVAIDLVILRAMALRRVLKTVERALAGQRLAIAPQHRFQFARQHRERPHRTWLFLLDREHRSVVLVKLFNRDSVHQTTPLTWMDRYPEIFSRCRAYFTDRKNLNILSYGCSTGEEVITLRR